MMDNSTPDNSTPDNEELRQLYEADQCDRLPPEGEAIDWSAVAPRDAERLARVKDLYQAGALHTGLDYFHAALILQHGREPNDYLLAHELCIVSLGQGETRAQWLAAATEDRFLKSIGRPQRFGTQFQLNEARELQLYAVDEDAPTVTDTLRAAMDVPLLAEAQAKEGRRI
ncbi:hypothetical protein [Vacuolonema iberomarrocanum]|uniref:hypothetical protein n=1 Tax=Vacuolonema iberomarrocanum TaxID=3454632 RepID=UPI0019EC2F00|nr:hypothetical protein [filamentous cyanobacterium LEGE 07170]